MTATLDFIERELLEPGVGILPPASRPVTGGIGINVVGVGLSSFLSVDAFNGTCKAFPVHEVMFLRGHEPACTENSESSPVTHP